MLKIAITGGAGTGKSTVARMFAELGAEVLNADQIARDVVAVGAPAWEELRRLYGPEYFNENGELNRSRLAQLVFADPEERSRLDRLIHPRVEAELKARVAELRRRGKALVLVEVPLLFETGREAAYDRVIVVTAPEAVQIRRLQGRDRRGPDEIRGMLKAQWPLTGKVARADYVVDNGGERRVTARQVKNIWAELKNQLDSSG
jgi:dephospho-CoA kinase